MTSRPADIPLRVGLGLAPTWAARDRTGLGPQLAAAERAGIDEVVLPDHVSFHNRAGWDGLSWAAAVLGMSEHLGAHVSAYLLSLRHPTIVARQVADIAGFAPGRLRLTVGVGGEDEGEYRACGIDPRTRGRRTDEALAILRSLLAGEETTFAGAHLAVDGVRVLPAPAVPVPVFVAGRSERARRRVAEHGDGWMPIWMSAPRFAQGIVQIGDLAGAGSRRDAAGFSHGFTAWCALDDDPRAGEHRLREHFSTFYRMPFEPFRPYALLGSPAEVADALGPYVDAGCRQVHLHAEGPSAGEVIERVGEIARLLRRRADTADRPGRP